MKNSIISNTAMIVGKVLEVFCLVMLAAFIVFFILIFAGQNLATEIVGAMTADTGEMVVNGFCIDVTIGKATIPASIGYDISRATLVAIAIAGLLSFPLRMMIFRNVYLIFKTAQGKTKFSKGETSFQKNISRMMREIGIFYILMPVLLLILNVILRPIAGEAAAEISVELDGIITGLIIIALSEVFTYGEKLESDVEGLV